jgi:hypothetical protein
MLVLFVVVGGEKFRRFCEKIPLFEFG